MKYLFVILILISKLTFPQIAVKGEKIYTMSGETIENGLILINGDKIDFVGKANEVTIPSDYKILEGKIVTPGLIDARSVVGLAGYLNYNHDQDQFEKSDPIQPELRAIDAYNPLEKLVDWLQSFGVTTINTGHAPGALISGQTFTVKTKGNTINEAMIDSISGVVFTLGPSVGRNFSKPGSRSKGIAMLRQEFLKAGDYNKKMKESDASKKPERNLKNEVLSLILDKKIPAIITAHSANDIMTALRLQKEFDFNLILDGASEIYLVIDEVKKANVPVFLHPTMMRTYGEMKNATFETAAKLNQAGILFAIQGGYENYVPKTRVVLFEAAIAASNGLPFESALASITINPAKILNLENRIGSIEKGKDADIVIFDGDPFEYTSHVCFVIINGELVKENCK